MELDVEALVTDPNQMLWVGLQPNNINAQCLRQEGPFALMDLQGADLTRAKELLDALQFVEHAGEGYMCGEIALAAHADAQCLMGFGGNPERANVVISSAEEACKALELVELNSLTHSSEISYACAAVRLADGLVSTIQEYHDTHEKCANLI